MYVYYSHTKEEFIAAGLEQTHYYDIVIIKGDSFGKGACVYSHGTYTPTGLYPQIEHGTDDTSIVLSPNEFHVWGTVSSLNITLGTPQESVVNEYVFQFSSGTTATNLVINGAIKWGNGMTGTISSGKTYQISILNGLGSIIEYEL